MAWSNEKYEYFGVEFYPSLEALQAYSRCLSELGFYQYIQSESYLGIPMDNSFPDFRFPSKAAQPEHEARDPLGLGFFEVEEDPPEPVYRVYLSRPAGFARLVPEAEREEILQHTQDACKMLGVQALISAFMRWNHESWEYFGIERFADMETAISYSQYLNEAGWYRITESISYLGSAYGGEATEEE
jgi:hypothetical protein